MSLSLILALVWLLAANILGALPSRDNHWRRAYALIAVGVPLWAWVVWQNGIWIGLAVLLCALSVLRWPVIYLGRWMRGKWAGQGGSAPRR